MSWMTHISTRLTNAHGFPDVLTDPQSQNGRTPLYLDASKTPAARAADLLPRMTLEEKIHQT
jgi:hypothetical protein